MISDTFQFLAGMQNVVPVGVRPAATSEEIVPAAAAVGALPLQAFAEIADVLRRARFADSKA